MWDNSNMHNQCSSNIGPLFSQKKRKRNYWPLYMENGIVLENHISTKRLSCKPNHNKPAVRHTNFQVYSKLTPNLILFYKWKTKNEYKEEREPLKHIFSIILSSDSCYYSNIKMLSREHIELHFWMLPQQSISCHLWNNRNVFITYCSHVAPFILLQRKWKKRQKVNVQLQRWWLMLTMFFRDDPLDVITNKPRNKIGDQEYNSIVIARS